MKLSMIIPAFNVEKYVTECLDSVLRTKKDIEVIVVDDGSTDSTLKICEEYCRKDNRVKVYTKPNGGVSSARNYGLEKASGEYILFVDSDDTLSENWDELYDFLVDDDIYYFDIDIKDSADKNQMLRYISGANDESICIAGPMRKGFRREFILEHNLRFQEELINGEDMFFNLEAVLLSDSYRIISFQYYFYRQTIGQATRRFDNRLIDSDTKFHLYLADLFQKYKVDKETAADICSFSLNNAVFIIINRISYIGRFSQAKKEFTFLEKEPYKNVLNNNNSFLFRLCRSRRYRTLYYYMKFKNKLSMLKNKRIGL